VGVVGGLTLLASLVLGIFAITKLGFSFSSAEGLGGLCFSLVCAFGVWASFDFLRGKSAKPLMVALMLGAVMDVIVLIGMPIVQANDTAVEEAADTVPVAKTPKQTGLDDDADIRIKNPGERLKESGGLAKIELGIGLLLVSAGILIYLSTAGVRKHFERPRLPSPLTVP
jgi:hypothetical protein